jgi:hypothetical protein
MQRAVTIIRAQLKLGIKGLPFNSNTRHCKLRQAGTSVEMQYSSLRHQPRASDVDRGRRPATRRRYNLP